MSIWVGITPAAIAAGLSLALGASLSIVAANALLAYAATRIAVYIISFFK